MKKNLLFASMAVAFAGLFTSCTFENGDNPAPAPAPAPVVEESTQNALSISGATYHTGSLPSSTLSTTISGITVNENALRGGMNFVTISTDQEYERFYVGIEGRDGYYEYVPETAPAASTRADGTSQYIYIIPINYSVNFNATIIMIIIAQIPDGGITAPFRAPVNYVESLSGDLNINLTFNNAKDVDLHLFTPSDKHIFYGDRGGSIQTDGGETITFGLDHDSNAACNIDNLNNENIYIPAEFIETGTYRVVVDMYANCDVTTATSWSIVTRYQGEIITPTTGANPASGVYPIGAGNGDMTTVMEFTIGERAATRSPFAKMPTFIPRPISIMDDMKADLAGFK